MAFMTFCVTIMNFIILNLCFIKYFECGHVMTMAIQKRFTLKKSPNQALEYGFYYVRYGAFDW